MNKCILMGRLVKDPETRTTQSGKQVCSFTLAVNRRQKGEADFINCQAWEKLAGIIVQYVRKGNQLLVEGRMQVRSYEDKQGNKRYVTEVIAENIDLLGSRSDNTSTGAATNRENWGKPAPDDDIPF